MHDRSGSFRQAVLKVVASIPEGRVTTYGRIAASIGYPRRARLVLAISGASDEGDFPAIGL